MVYSIALFYILLFVVAFLYSSVGHGGASGYLALMSFYSFAPVTMRPIALILNLFVSLIAFIQYYRKGHFRWSLFWPFALASIPAAFVGGLINVDADLYKKVLAGLLLFSVLKLLDLKFHTKEFIVKQNIYLAMLIGTTIGLFSGMIGIGGGIILGPLILLLNWADMKQTATVSALFIFVNSLAGLTGLLLNGVEFEKEMGIMIIITFVGGMAGSYLGAGKFNNIVLKRILAVVLVIASIKLIVT